MTNNTIRRFHAGLLLVLLASFSHAFAGGPLIIFSPGTPYKYPGAVAMFTDNDPIFSTSEPAVTNAVADATVVGAIAQWTGVATATFSSSVAGDFASIGLPDITLANVFDVLGAFNGGGYHVIYDHDGSIIDALAGPGVLGFSSPEFATIGTPDLLESYAVLNGASVSAGDVTLSAWSGVITHEFGHGIGLAHTQTNGAVGFFGDDIGPGGCPPAGLPYGGFPALADLETMYPFIDPSLGGTGPDMFTVDHPDDISSLSNIYPEVGWPSSFGTITGTIFSPDGTTPLGGVNVIARNVANPFGDAISALSGDFTQTPGDGLYTFNGLTPGAAYVVYVDEIVLGGFSQEPIFLPSVEEFFNGASESTDPDIDNSCDFSTITATAGSPFIANISFNRSNLANDLCSGAVAVACGNVVSGTTVGALLDNAGFCGTGNTAPGVWYKFAGNGDIVTAATCNAADFDTKISVFSGSCASLSCLGGVDDSPGCAGFTSQFSWASTPGVDYFILVHGFGNETGNFDLSISCTTPTGNDVCSSALPVSCGQVVTGTTVGMTLDNVGVCGTSNTAPGVWYSFTGSGELVTATTCNPGTTYDTKLSVFSGSCAALTCVNGNDDVSCSFAPFRSEVTWLALPGVDYFILVHGFGSDTGDFELGLTCAAITNAEPGLSFGSTGLGGTNPGSLLRIDPVTPSATLLGSTGQARVPGLAINSKGEIFGSTGGLNSNLIRIDAATGASGSVGATGLAFADALAFDTNDVLYAVDGNNDLYTIDPATALATFVGNIPIASGFVVGLAFEPGTGKLFGSQGGLNGNDEIYEIDPASGAVRVVGQTGFGGATPALLFVGSTMYGTKNTSAINSNLIRIDTATGAGTLVGPIGFGSVSGLASLNPHQYVFLADDLVKINKNIASNGSIHSNGSIDFGKGAPGTHTGNLTALDDITIRSQNTIVGEVTAGDDVYRFGSATITGNKSAETPVTPVKLPSFSFTAGGPSHTVPEYGAQTLAPGSYGTVEVEEKGTLHLSAGDYYLDALDTEERAVISINVTNGRVNIYVVEKLDFEERVKVRIVGAGASTSLVTFVTLQESKIDIGMNAKIQGALIAPHAEVHFAAACKFKGSISAESITLNQNVLFSFHSVGVLQKEADEDEADEDNAEENPAETVAVITDYELAQNYPNPFNPSTQISFALPEAGEVTLSIFAQNGQLVRQLVNREMAAGRHNLRWDGRNQQGHTVAAGVYLYRIVAHDQNGNAVFNETRRMTLLK